MEQETTHEMLTKIVQSVAQEPAGYFCHEGVYCEEVDCDGYEDCDECDDGYDDELEPCEHCKGGDDLDYCDSHNGSVLDVTHHVSHNYSGNGSHNVTVVVGTGGPHIELDTRQQQVIGYWGNTTVRKHYPHTSEVNEFWEEMYGNIRS